MKLTDKQSELCAGCPHFAKNYQGSMKVYNKCLHGSYHKPSFPYCKYEVYSYGSNKVHAEKNLKEKIKGMYFTWLNDIKFKEHN